MINRGIEFFKKYSEMGRGCNKVISECKESQNPPILSTLLLLKIGNVFQWTDFSLMK